VSDSKIRGFYPSLYLNMGSAHENLGSLQEAKRFYALAQGSLDVLIDDRYGNVVRDAVQRGLAGLNSKLTQE
jgi:hypothetical protein